MSKEPVRGEVLGTAEMNVRDALARRHSVRAFRDQQVPIEQLRELAIWAACAPSGGNLQPWHIDVVYGDALVRLKAIMAQKTEAGVRESLQYPIYPANLTSPYEDRRQEIGEAMYGQLGIPRMDKAARRNWFAHNFQLFGAPAVYFCSIARIMGPPQWSDLGMYLQSLMLLATDAGLATCPQESWAMYHDTVGRFLDLPDDRILFCGVAVGYEDHDSPVNLLESSRAASREWLKEHS